MINIGINSCKNTSVNSNKIKLWINKYNEYLIDSCVLFLMVLMDI